jgi:hypothetical protein
MNDFEDFFKVPTTDEIDRAWLNQLCLDGQMDDDEIPEFIDAVIEWKNNSIKRNNDKK